MPRLRDVPEDFVVDEVPLYPPCGEGDHTFVQIEKRLRTTEEVARDLARAADVRPRDVGYAGRKDRRAVTTQWFSVPGLDPQRAEELELAGARVLGASRHRHKLRTGHLAGNRFELWVRDVPAVAVERAPAVVEELARRGFANRYGEQRFGGDGENAARGLAVLRGESSERDRRRARFWLSALQARVFNAVLAGRPLPPHLLEEGDLAMVQESGGVFPVEDVALEQPRADRFEISPTGPIFGTRAPEPAGEPGRRERAVLADLGVPTELRAPRGLRLRGARRPLRARPLDVRVRTEGADLRLCFTLPPGAYATVFVEEILAASGSDDTGAPGAVELPARR